MLSYASAAAALRTRTGEAVFAGGIAALVLTAAVLVSLADPAARPAWQGGGGLLVAATAALLWRREHPVPVLVVTAVFGGAYFALGFAGGPEPIPFVVALYAAAAEGHRIAALAAIPGVVGVVAGVNTVRAEPLPGAGELAAIVATLATVVALGELGRARRAYLREAQDRAALAERLRIARDLHDQLGHRLAVISVQAGAALLRGRDRPEVAEAALTTIREASTEAAGELRATLGALRFGSTPGLDRLADLLRDVRETGLEVRHHVEGTPWPLPAATEEAAYRIVQEALTNVLRHARASTVDVTTRYRGRWLELEIRDDGTAAPGPEGGGLRGMRERASGRLTAGPAPGGGFAVRARLRA
ncbi:sensor histidine kinase [Amycolatopsis suaedae]|uniref:histidine kinase n=1 Tax=Amycolatopsis suaedae TaxID=2510978 RepID=A0A4Q7JA82_9PSEU|nr:sensor histidine kinase [Amycolatopsis suaedae]RZQ64710.1 sensor histidine kinase [Amycolatopsis suaedae]